MKRLLALMVVVAVAVCIGCGKEAPKKSSKTPVKETPPPVMKGPEKPAEPAPSAEKKDAAPPAEKKVAAPEEKKDAPPPAPEKKDAPPAEKKDAAPPAPEKK
jgi:hypothetical protein